MMIYCETFYVIRRVLSESRRYTNGNIRRFSKNCYVHNPGTEPLTYATLGDVLEYSAHKWPDRIAVHSVYENKQITYQQLIAQADLLGGFLRAQGFVKGDRLGIWSHNSLAWVVTLVAAVRAGLITVGINPYYEKPELSFSISKTGLKGLVIGNNCTSRDYYKTLEQLIPQIKVSKPGAISSELFPYLSTIISCGTEHLSGTFNYESIISTTNGYTSSVSQYSKEISPDDGCIIHLTSGTSGTPKAALVSHFAYVNNTYFTGKRLNLHKKHHHLCVQVPIFHALGSVIGTLASLRHGCTIVLPAPTYNVEANLESLYTEKCSVIIGTPTMYVDLVNEVKQRNAPPAHLQLALTAGAPCSPQLLRRMHDDLQAENVVSLFGMTETTAGTFLHMLGDNEEKITDTVGYLMDHVEAKVVDKEGRIVPFGFPGELWIRSYCNMMNYYNDQEKTNETILKTGWLRTGDKFVLTEDGYGAIVGRLKDIIVRGGENIAPKEIEDVLDTHPDIIESQVIGVPDERLGEDLCAVIRIRSNSGFTIKDLRDHCSGKIAKFKIPRTMKIVEEYPKTVSGKIQKFRLKALYEIGKL